MTSTKCHRRLESTILLKLEMFCFFFVPNFDWNIRRLMAQRAAGVMSRISKQKTYIRDQHVNCKWAVDRGCNSIAELRYHERAWRQWRRRRRRPPLASSFISPKGKSMGASQRIFSCLDSVRLIRPKSASLFVDEQLLADSLLSNIRRILNSFSFSFSRKDALKALSFWPTFVDTRQKQITQFLLPLLRKRKMI